MSDLLSVEDAWARLATHIEWADRFWIAFVFTDDPRVIEALGRRTQEQLAVAGRGFVSLRPSRSEAIDEVFAALLGGQRAAVAWVDLVRHDAPSQAGAWRAAWERLMLRLNERRELLRRRWSKGGIVFATTLNRMDETPALAPDLWTIRAMGLRVASQLAELPGEHAEPSGHPITRRSADIRSPQLARQAVERVRKRGDDLGLLEGLVTLAQAENEATSLKVAREARALAERLLRERTDDEARSSIAALLEELAEALAPSGNHPGPGARAREALELMQEAVEVRRQLAQANPGAHLSLLAMALDNYGVHLSSLGRPEEALAVTQDAVEHYRRSVTQEWDPYLLGLASALNNLGVKLSSLGRQEEALAATQEAVDYFRKLAMLSPNLLQPYLATALNNLGTRLGSLGRQEQAVAATRQAVAHYRKLAEASPSAYLPNLASSLAHLGFLLSSLARREEAIAVTQEAVEHYRKLAEASPDAYSPHLTLSLGALGNVYARLGEYSLASDCWAAALRTILPSFPNLAAHDDMPMRLAQALRALSEDYGVGIPEDLAAVVAQLIEVNEPTSDH